MLNQSPGHSDADDLPTLGRKTTKERTFKEAGGARS